MTKRYSKVFERPLAGADAFSYAERGCGVSEKLPHREIIVYEGDGNVSLEVKTDGEKKGGAA